MVKIRLSRGGAKKKPFYHLVATDSRKEEEAVILRDLDSLILWRLAKKLNFV